MPDTSASIIISNHNYARFLPAAIESALGQTVPVEVIVVDDGSSDGSAEVIESFGGRIRSILKPCGGQASAINAGFALSRGDVVLLLDADDVLHPDAVETAASVLGGPGGPPKAHWPLEVIDAAGDPVGRRHPATPLPEGDFRAELIARGPWMCETPPTSGNAWSRRFLERVLPMPEAPFRLCADAYLLGMAPLHGPLRRIDRPLSRYRLHGGNHYWDRPFEEQLARSVATYETQCAAVGEALRRDGIAFDPEAWRRHSWWHRLRSAVEAIVAAVPEGQPFAAADGDEWGTPAALRGRRRVPFPSHDGVSYAGHPVDDADAVANLERLRRDGVHFLALGWPAAWYPEVYPQFSRKLRDEWCPAVREDAVTVYRSAAG